MRWVLGAVVLLAIGLAFQLGLLVYAMYVLIGVIAISRILTWEWVDQLVASREVSRQVVEVGEKVAIIVNVNNRGRLPIAWLLLEDSISKEALQQKPPRLELDGKRTSLIRLPGGGQKSLLYQVRFLMRGYYQLGPVLLESGDLFGLHRRFRVETSPAFVLVYPKVVPLLGYDVASRRPMGEVRMTHRLFEDPTRLAGVREYQHGDSFNRVHWRATARTGKLHCKLYEPSCVAGATILLDFHQSGYPAMTEPTRSELAITAAASLAHAVYQLGQQVGLVTNARDAADRVREEGYRQEFHTRAMAQAEVDTQVENNRLRPVVVPTRRGADSFQRIRETLARAELTDGLTLPQLILEASSRLPRDASIIAILSTVPVEAALALGMLKRQGFSVTAILVQNDESDDRGRLIAQGIDTRLLPDETCLPAICWKQMAG